MQDTLEPTIGQMKDFLRPEPRLKPPKVQKRKIVSRKSLRRKLPEQVRRAIVMLVFKSSTNFTKKIQSPTTVARLFNISDKTVQSVITSFKKQQCRLEDFKDGRQGRKSWLEEMEPRIKRELLRKDLL